MFMRSFSKSKEYYELFQRKLKNLEKLSEEYKSEVCGNYPRGLAVDIPHSNLCDFLISYGEVKKKINEIKERIERHYGCVSLAVVGDWGEGKTQLARFLYHEFHSDSSYYVALLDAFSPSFFDELQKGIYNSSKSNIIVLIDGIDSIFSRYTTSLDHVVTSTSPQLAVFAQRLAGFLQLTDRPWNDRKVAIVLFLTTSNYLALRNMFGGERRLSEVKLPDLVLGRDSEDIVAEAALNVLAILSLCNEKVRDLISRRAEDVIEILMNWAMAYYRLHGGKVNIGKYIKTFSEIFEKILLNSEDIKTLQSVELGNKVEEVIKELLCSKTVNIENRYAARIECDRRSPGQPQPDFIIKVYPGSLPEGIKIFEIYGEIKIVTSDRTLSTIEDQLETYLERAPVLLLLFTNKEEIEEKLISKFSERSFEMLSYSPELVYPLLYVREPRVREDIFESIYGKAIERDLEDACKKLLSRTYEIKPLRMPIKAEKEPEYRRMAESLVDKALRPSEAKERVYKRIKSSLDEIVSKYGLSMNTEEVLNDILDKLIDENFLTRKSERKFVPVPDSWRSNKDKAITIISEILKTHAYGGASLTKFIAY